MITWYPSQEAALKRADVLRRDHGIWPGVVGPRCMHQGCPRPARCWFRRSHADEWRWRLTYDPAL